MVMNEAKACKGRDPTTPLEMDRPYIMQASHQHHKAGHQMEPPEKKEEEKVMDPLAMAHGDQNQGDELYLGAIEEDFNWRLERKKERIQFSIYNF